MKAFLALAFAALFAVESFGVDAVWKNTATTAQEWHDLKNWSVGGEAATDLPTNTTDTVSFPDIDTTVRAVNLAAAANRTVGIASVTGGEYWQLVFNVKGTGGGDTTETFGFSNINGFTGEWRSTGGKKTLKLTATSGTQTLTAASVAGQFSVDVANADTTADILTLKGTSGSLKKSGAGDLRVREVADAGDLVLELEEGNVQIDGKMKDPLAAARTIVQKSAVWLDASASETWEAHAYTDDSGRTRVTNWVDAAGREIKARIWDNSGDSTESHIKDIKPPFISAKTSSTGLPLMDFGTASSTSTELPQALMRLSGSVQVQEAFYVSEIDSGTQILGDTSDYSFASGENYAFTYGEAITNNGGFAFFNGGHKTPTLVLNGNYWRIPRQTDTYSPTKNNALQLTDVCFGTGNAKPVSLIASDRVYKSNSGGVRIGEVLLFTVRLTDDERKVLTEYLMGKWFANYNHKDFDVANVADGTSITVPEGQIVRISTLRATGTTFMKKGAGTLELGRIYPEDLTITVEGGDVELKTEVREDVSTAPAGTPQLWFDANAADVFVTEGENVTAWKDCRNNGKQATRLTFDQITAYPTADTTRVSGKTTLTFPSKAAFSMPIGDGSRETFIAFCYTGAPGYYNVLSEGYRTSRRMKVNNVYQYYTFAAPDVGYEPMAGGTFSIDGKPVRPFEWTGTASNPGTTFVAGQWYVVHLSTTRLASLNRLASDGPRQMTGNVSYGEVITYDTALSSEERVATIDYLMRKWLGRRHPEYEKPATDISLAFDGDATLGGETDETYAAVTGVGALTKTGAGSATVTAELSKTFTDLDVQGGSLAIAKPTEPPDRSAFRFDISDASTITEYFIGEDDKTNVVRLADATGKSISAYCPGWDSYILTTNPVVEQVEMRPGIVRPTMDMLDSRGRYPSSSASVKTPDPTPGAGLSFSQRYTDIREAHVIFSDRGSNASVIFGDTGAVPFNRGGSRHLFATSVDATGTKAWAAVQEGDIWLDGQPATCSTSLPNGFHLVSLKTSADVPLSTMGRERNISVGGNYQSEIVGFREVLPDDERTYLMSALMHKWFGTAEPVWTNTIDSVTVAKDATLTVAGGAILSPTVTGGGKIEATRVLGIAALNLKATDRTTVEGLTVEGVADFAGAVAVTLTGTDAARLKAGKYALVTATSFANLDLSQWTLSPAQLKNEYRFVQEGNTVFLEIQPNGMLLIVR